MHKIEVSPGGANEVLRDPRSWSERNLAETIMALAEIVRSVQAKSCPCCMQDYDSHAAGCRWLDLEQTCFVFTGKARDRA